MTTTPPDDIAALFGLEPEPASPPAATQDADALEAAEAALAAEIASEIDAGAVAGDAPDARTDLRVDVSWRARMRLPDGRVVEIQVRNVSEGGVGLMSGEHIPARTVVAFEMDVPPADDGGDVGRVHGTIRTTYTVARAAEVFCGGTWQAPPAGLELVRQWIARLRR